MTDQEFAAKCQADWKRIEEQLAKGVMLAEDVLKFLQESEDEVDMATPAQMRAANAALSKVLKSTTTNKVLLDSAIRSIK